MAFQLMAFFIMTFRPPSMEGRVDLLFPSAPIALPRGDGPPATPIDDLDLGESVLLRATADANGNLASLTMGENTLADAVALEDRLTRYAEVIRPAALRIRLWADDSLRYDEAARLIASCSKSGASAIQLVGPE
jgi:biopolymer transport protein ExbD